MAEQRFDLVVRDGTIVSPGRREQAGSDADLTLWDPAEQRVINGTAMASRAGYSACHGWAVTGWPRFVIRRGQTVLADRQCTAQPGQGAWVPRGPGRASRRLP